MKFTWRIRKATRASLIVELRLKNTSVAIFSGGEAGRQNENTLGAFTHPPTLSFANNMARTKAKDGETVVDTTHILDTHINLRAGFTPRVCETVGRSSSVSSLIAVI